MKFSKITISGLICTGKTSLFWGLQEELVWPTFSTSQYFRDYARTHRFLLEKAEEQNDKITKKVDFRVAKMLKEKGNLLVEGWMAGIMADNYPGIFKILLVCDDAVRIQRFAAREKVDLKEAEKKVVEREKNLLGTLARIYKRNDFLEPEKYDLVFDTTKTTKKQLIKTMLDKLGFKET